MNNPATETEVINAVRSFDRIRIQGGNTKSHLSGTSDDAEILNLQSLSGVIEYQPSEFTFSARAGTTISELIATLAERGQYLPFDPLWVQVGATLGGTVAANAAGPGRIRFGGVRDFILGVRIVDGCGRSINGGGKVVKNAAGFDLPKLFSGSLGRWGVMTEITCKVFPRPESSVSHQWTFDHHPEAMNKLIALSKSSLEPDAIEYDPETKTLFLRVSGPSQALPQLAERIGGAAGPASEWWKKLNEFEWSPIEASLVRVPLTPLQVPTALQAIEESITARCWVSGAGNSLWISTREIIALHRILLRSDLTGLVYKAPAKDGSPLWVGTMPDRKIDAALQAVFDPRHRFSKPI